MDIENSFQSHITTDSLLEYLGKTVVVIVRGYHNYIGNLKSVDHFGNIVLYKTIERIFVYDKYCDIDQGLLIVRATNIVMIGELNDSYKPEESIQKVSEEEIFQFQKEMFAAFKTASKKRRELLARRGITVHEINDFLLEFE